MLQLDTMETTVQTHLSGTVVSDSTAGSYAACTMPHGVPSISKVLTTACSIELVHGVMQARLHVLCRYPNNARIEQLISLESILPNGQKKVPKVYQIACHPLQPHLVAVAANAGNC